MPRKLLCDISGDRRRLSIIFSSWKECTSRPNYNFALNVAFTLSKTWWYRKRTQTREDRSHAVKTMIAITLRGQMEIKVATYQGRDNEQTMGQDMVMGFRRLNSQTYQMSSEN